MRGFRVRDRRGGDRYFIDNALLRGGWGKVIGPYGIAVYNALVIHADADAQDAWPSYQTLADLTGMSKRQVIRKVAQLESLNIIAKENRFKDDEQTSNIYYLIHRDDWKTQRGEPQSPPSEQESPKQDPCNKTQVDSPSDYVEPTVPPELDVKALRSSLASFFREKTNIPYPQGDGRFKTLNKCWWGPLLKISSLCEYDVERTRRLIEWAIKHCDTSGLTIRTPQSIEAIAVGEQCRRKRTNGAPRPNGSGDHSQYGNGYETGGFATGLGEPVRTDDIPADLRARYAVPDTS